MREPGRGSSAEASAGKLARDLRASAGADAGELEPGVYIMSGRGRGRRCLPVTVYFGRPEVLVRVLWTNGEGVASRKLARESDLQPVGAKGARKMAEAYQVDRTEVPFEWEEVEG